MARDHRKLNVFGLADALVLEVYAKTQSFPDGERYGLRSQIRRAAVSVPCNIVEGSARRSRGEYLHFLHIANASAQECRYLIDLARRLKLMSPQDALALDAKSESLNSGLGALLRSLSKPF
jgi:four helix bundle protein